MAGLATGWPSRHRPLVVIQRHGTQDMTMSYNHPKAAGLRNSTSPELGIVSDKAWG